MSRSFYLLENDEPALEVSGRPHIPYANKLGDRSEAGWYCTRDRLTLCKEGPDGVHAPGATWFDTCPVCEAEPPDEPLRWAHSFTWALPPGTVLNGGSHEPLVGKLVAAIHRSEAVPEVKPIIDDSGKLFTIEEFFAVVGSCELRFNEPTLVHA